MNTEQELLDICREQFELIKKLQGVVESQQKDHEALVKRVEMQEMEISLLKMKEASNPFGVPNTPMRPYISPTVPNTYPYYEPFPNQPFIGDSPWQITYGTGTSETNITLCTTNTATNNYTSVLAKDFEGLEKRWKALKK